MELSPAVGLFRQRPEFAMGGVCYRKYTMSRPDILLADDDSPSYLQRED